MNDYHIKPSSRERLKTLYREAETYRLLQNAQPQNISRYSSFKVLRRIAFWLWHIWHNHSKPGGETV